MSPPHTRHASIDWLKGSDIPSQGAHGATVNSEKGGQFSLCIL